MSRITAITRRLAAGSALLAGLLFGALTIATGPARAQDAGPAIGGKIAFIRADNVWLLNLGDQTQRQLTSSGDCEAPSWSPDGTKLVYVRRSGFRDTYLWILDVAAGKASRLTSKPSEYTCPRWSPDGEWVACFSFDDELGPMPAADPNRLLKISLQTKAVTVLAKGLWGGMSVAWAPDSSALAYSYGTEGKATLAGLLLSEESPTPKVFCELTPDHAPDVAIREIRWSEPSSICFYETIVGETSSLSIRQMTADGKVTTVHDFGETATAAISLNADGSGGPWLVTDEEGLWLWQGNQKTKLLEEVSNPAWTCTP